MAGATVSETTSTSTASANADNDQTAAITGNQLAFGASSTVELGPGNYYLERIEPASGQRLVLNTTNGDVRIAVRDYVKLREAKIRVIGDGSVDIVVQSQNTVSVTGSRDVHFHVGKAAEVDVPGRNSNQLSVFGPQ